MSRTLHIACHDCKVRLWIGQYTLGQKEEGHIYTTHRELRLLTRFLFEHAGHRIESNESELIDHDYRDLEIEVEEDI